MSDPIAVSILAKLTSWYTFDNTGDDAHGAFDLTMTAATYSPGLQAQQVNKNSRGGHTYASPPAFGTTTGLFTIGGWFNYTTSAANRAEFGFFYPSMVSGAEAFVIVVHPAGYFYVETWEDAGVTDSDVRDPLIGAINYPVTFQVEDSTAQTATSEQIVRIVSGVAMQPGRYFVVATWDAGNRALYMDSLLVDTNTPPAAVKQSTIGKVALGRDLGSAPACMTDVDEAFVCLNAVMTQEEITWIYNGGAGRSYADVVAAAA
jgi:hypothetical protein